MVKMGIMDGVKDIYYAWEEKYYHFLEKYIPAAFTVTDRIDQVVPSFLVLLALLFIIIASGVIFFIAPFFFSPQLDIQFKVADETTRQSIVGAQVALTVNGQFLDSYRTTAEGLTPSILLRVGDVVDYNVSANGYLQKSQRGIRIDDATLQTIFLESSAPDFRDVTINFRTRDTEQPITNTPITVSFACSPISSNAPPSRTLPLGTSTMTVNVPTDCATLLVSAQAVGYTDVISEPISGNLYTIHFSERDDLKGTINVHVVFNGQGAPNILVNLFEADVGPMDSAYTDEQGNAVFKVSPTGEYRVQTAATDVFGNASQDNIEVAAAESVNVELVLQSNVTGSLKINVREQGNANKKIGGARVSLRLGNIRLADATTDTNTASVTFPISQIGSYTVTIDHPDYLVKEEIVPITASGNTERTISLTRYTGQGTTIKVKVVDEETNKTIKRARVALYRIPNRQDAECETGGQDLIAAEAELLDLDRYTDVNGIARFERMTRGCYAAIAIRGESIGKSDPSYFRENDTNKMLTVMLAIPRGAIRVNVMNEIGEPVPFARVEIFDDFDNSRIGSDITDAQGLFELPASNNASKADKDVYVRVTSAALQGSSVPEYSAYTSEARPIIGNGIQVFNVTMRKPLLQGEIKIVFEGLKSVDGNKTVRAGTNTVSSGVGYHATWLVFVPEGQFYDDVTVHARTGKFELAYGELETDPSLFENVNMPLASLIKATAIDPVNGEESDYASVTADKFKWFNAYFPRLGPGVYQLGADLTVKDTTTLSDKIMLRWRVEGELDGDPVRYPEDASSPTNSLYANTLYQLYQVGAVTLCDADFCFDSTVFDQTEQLVNSVIDSFEAKTGQNYKLSFSLSNNSAYKTYPDNAASGLRNRFKVDNPEDSLQITNYNVTSTQTFRNPSFLGNTFELNIGDLGGGERGSTRGNITGDFQFLAKSPGTHTLNFNFIHKAQIVFQKTITITAISNKTMDVNVDPTVLPAALENRIAVKVRDSQTKVEVENAIITVNDRFDNTIGMAKTDRLGNAEIFLQGLEAGDNLNVEVSAPDYAPAIVPLTVSDQILEAKPKELGFSLNINSKFQDAKEIELKNWSEFPITLTRLEYIGNSNGLLDESEIANNLIQFEGMQIPAGETRKITLAMFLSEEGKLITDLEQLTGELQIESSNYGQVWTTIVGAKTSIGLGQLLDNETCLVITPVEWVNTSQGAPVTQEFILQNNCSVNGEPVAIRDLEASVKWNSNPIGTFQVGISDGETTGAIGSATITEGYFKKLIGSMPAEKQYNVTITFTPRGGVNGLADATITFQSHNLTDGKSDQLLSQDISAKISTINLLQCLTISKDLIIITKTPNVAQSTGEFTVQNKVGCGEIELTIDKCLKDGLECQPLEVSPQTLTVADGGTSPSIQIITGEDTYPGQYAIRVKAKAKSQKLAQEITSLLEKDKFIRVRVFDPEQCLTLDKYEFEVFDDQSTPDNEGQDRTRLTNYCPNKQLTVKIDTKQFFDEAKKSGTQQLLDILGHLLGTGINYGINNGIMGGILQNTIAPTLTVTRNLQEAARSIKTESTNANASVKMASSESKKVTELFGKIKGTATSSTTDSTTTAPPAGDAADDTTTPPADGTPPATETPPLTLGDVFESPSGVLEIQLFKDGCVTENSSIATADKGNPSLTKIDSVSDKIKECANQINTKLVPVLRKTVAEGVTGEDQRKVLNIISADSPNAATPNDYITRAQLATKNMKSDLDNLLKRANELKTAASNASAEWKKAKESVGSTVAGAKKLKAYEDNTEQLRFQTIESIKEVQDASAKMEEAAGTGDTEKTLSDNYTNASKLVDAIKATKQAVEDAEEALNDLKTEVNSRKMPSGAGVTGLNAAAATEIGTKATAVSTATDGVKSESATARDTPIVDVAISENVTTTINDTTTKSTELLSQVSQDVKEVPQEEKDAQKFLPESSWGGLGGNMLMCLFGNHNQGIPPTAAGQLSSTAVLGQPALGSIYGNPILYGNPGSNSNYQAAQMQQMYANNNCPPGSPFGPPNGISPFLMAQLATIGEEDILELQVVQPDVVVTMGGIALLRDNALEPDTDFTVAAQGKTTVEPKRTTRLNVFKYDLKFQNNLVNPDSVANRTTFFKTLLVPGKKYEYNVDKVYKPSDFKVNKPRKIELNVTVSQPGIFDVVFNLFKGKKKDDHWTDQVITAGDFDPEKATLTLLKDYPKDVKQYFHVQFNNISPFEIVSPDFIPNNQECVAFTPPGVTGLTGKEALPRVKYAWNWSNNVRTGIRSNECDVDFEDSIFCDATQFTIATLKKTQVIREFLENNGANLHCPSILNALEGKEQEIGKDDIGIASITPNVRGGDVNMVVEVKNTAVVSEPRTGKLTMTFKNANNNQVQTCTQDVNVRYKQLVSCTFSAPQATSYTVSAQLENLSGCETSACDTNPANNAITTSVLIGQSVQTVCPLPGDLPTMSRDEIAAVYNTHNLPRFIEQSERDGVTLNYENSVLPGMNKDEFVKLLNNDVRLMQDGYSTDFQTDFDHYSQTTIFNAPAYYLTGSNQSSNTGLSRLFSDPQYWQFSVGGTQGTRVLPGPGVYNVEILMGFDNPNWRMFTNDGKVGVNVNVVMKKSGTTGTGQLSDRILPFYYMPFDGLVGTLEGDNGRTGYGVDFTGDAIKIQNEVDGLTTQSIASSTPYSDRGVVDVKQSNNFLQTNQGEGANIRGQILRVARLPNPTITYSPSFATPVFLSLTNLRGEPCALYNLATINNSLTYTGSKATDWWGLAAPNCKDFMGNLVLDDTFYPMSDKSNATTGNFQTICASQIQPGTYGIEYPGTQVKRGNVTLKTIFYTPQSNSNSIQMYSASDFGRFIGQTIEGPTVPLNGVAGMQKNNPGSQIQSLQDIFDLVENMQVCVSSGSSDVKFWWNPTRILKTVEDKERNLSGQCIIDAGVAVIN